MSPIDPGALVGDVVSAPVIQSVSPEDGKNTITWAAVSGATSYALFWKTAAGVTKRDTRINGITSPYEHTGLTNDTTYYYVMVSEDVDTESDESNELNGKPTLGANPPTAQPLFFGVAG